MMGGRQTDDVCTAMGWIGGLPATRERNVLSYMGAPEKE